MKWVFGLLVVCLVADANDPSRRVGALKNATTTDGWFVLGSTCMGYALSAENDHVGRFDLMVQGLEAPYPDGLEVLLYDDQKTSYYGLSAGMTCEERVKMAKDAEEVDSLFTVEFDENGQWYSPGLPISSKMGKVRRWWLVLADCDNTKNFNVAYDLKIEHTGLYARGTGPNKCSPGTAPFQDGGHAKMLSLTGLVIGLGFAVLVLVFLLCRSCQSTRNLKKGGNTHQAVAMEERGESAILDRNRRRSDAESYDI